MWIQLGVESRLGSKTLLCVLLPPHVEKELGTRSLSLTNKTVAVGAIATKNTLLAKKADGYTLLRALKTPQMYKNPRPF